MCALWGVSGDSQDTSFLRLFASEVRVEFWAVVSVNLRIEKEDGWLDL